MHEMIRRELHSGRVTQLQRWKHEIFALVTHDFEHVLDMDGCALDLFGGFSFSVHLIAWTPDGLRYWVPRRAADKWTYPSKLDNTVSSSLASRESPLDCIVREAEAEASLPQEYTRAHIKSCETLSYAIAQLDDGSPGCQNQVQYIYEMEVDEDVHLTPGDDEVDSFSLMSSEEVQKRLLDREFKLNCA